MRRNQLSLTLVKTVAAGIVFLLGLALAAPALVGLHLARDHEQLVASLNLPGSAHLEIIDFERGWFSSRLRLRLIPDRCPAGNCADAILENVIHHGPWPITAPGARGDTLVKAMIETRLDLATLFGGLQVQPRPPTLTIITRLPLAGGVVAHATLPASDLRLTGGWGEIRLSTGRLSAGLRVSPAGVMLLDIQWPRFALVVENGGQFAFQGLNAGFKAVRGAWRNYLLAVDSVRYATAGGRAAAMKALRLDATAAAEGGSQIAMHLTSLSTRGNIYGPALLNGRLRLQGGAAAPPLPALAMAVATTASPQIALLRNEPRLHLERVRLTTVYGDLRGELTLRVNADAAPAGALIRALRGRLMLTLPEPVMVNITAAVIRHRHPDLPPPTPARVEKAIAGWLERGFISYRESNNAYVIRARLRGRDLIVNGRRLENWPALLAQMQHQRS